MKKSRFRANDINLDVRVLFHIIVLISLLGTAFIPFSKVSASNPQRPFQTNSNSTFNPPIVQNSSRKTFVQKTDYTTKAESSQPITAVVNLQEEEENEPRLEIDTDNPVVVDATHYSGQCQGTPFTYVLGEMSGIMHWVCDPEVGTFENPNYQKNKSYLRYHLLNVPLDPVNYTPVEIEICSQGNLPYINWNTTDTFPPPSVVSRSPVHAAPDTGGYGGYDTDPYYYDDWLCVHQQIDLHPGNNIILIGHPFLYIAHHPNSFSEAGTNADYEWQYWVKRINTTEFEEPAPLNDQSGLSSNLPKIGSGDPRECEIAGCSDGQVTTGDPIDPRTGNFDYSTVDLSLSTIAGPLSFQKSYSSQAIDTNLYPTEMSPGWTHNQDIRLSVQNSGGKTYVWFKAHTANSYLFTSSGNNVYKPYRGVLASLTYANQLYTVTTYDHSTYQFNSAKKISKWINAQNREFDYSYYSNGKLKRVTEPVSGRYLECVYEDANGNGKLMHVKDQTNRQVSFGYTNGDLTSFTDVRGQTWIYGYQSHRLTTIKEPSSAHKTILTNVYDADRVTSQLDGLNKPIVQITYNSDGSRTIKDALNRQSQVFYNDRKLLSKQVDSTQYTTTYSYYSSFRVKKITGQNNRLVSYSWSADGANMTRMKDAGGYTTSMAYTQPSYPTHLTQVIDPLGNTLSYTYDGEKLMNATRPNTSQGDITTSYTYTTAQDQQPVGLLKTVTDDLDRSTSLVYYPNGELWKIIDAKQKTTVFTYDSLGRVTDVTNPLGRVTHYVYDPAGNVTKIVQNYVPARQKNEQNQYNLTTDLIYDVQGRLYLVTDTLNHTTTYVYDDAGRLYQTLDAYSKATTYGYNDAGQITSVTDPLSHSITYEYDATTGRLTRVKDNSGKTLVSYTYNPDSTIYSATMPTPWGNYVVTYQYDNLKRVTSVSDNAGYTQSATYDPFGNPLTQTDALDRVTKYEYNDLELLWKATQNFKAGVPADNETNVITEYRYDSVGNLKKIIDANSHETNFDYTELNQLWTITDPRLKVTEYGYDDLGNATSIIDANNNTTIYGYDLADRLNSIDYPGGVTPEVSFGYDALGRMTGMDDALGHTTWVYDDLNRITSITDPFNKTVGYGYDDDSKRTSITYPAPVNRTITYQYNALDQLEHVLDGSTHLADYTYDIANQLASVTRGNGVGSTYGYDLSGQVTDVTHWKKTGQWAKLTYQYDTVGNPEQVTEAFLNPRRLNLPVISNETGSSGMQSEAPDGVDAIPNDGVTDPYPAPEEDSLLPESGSSAHDAHPSTSQGSFAISLNTVWNWVVSLVSGLFSDNTPTVSAHSDYQGYPPPGVTPTPGSGGYYVPTEPTFDPEANVIDYTYDALNRLIGFADSTGRSYSYTYDKVGNRATQTVDGVTTVYSYDEADRLTNAGGVSYTWDDNGNLLNDGTFTYGYDFADRLTSAADSQNTYSFSYDGLGNRYGQTSNGTAITYALDLAASLPQVLYDGSTTYFYGLDRIAQQKETATEYFLGDALGSVRQTTDNDGVYTSNQSFDPFGNTVTPFSNPTELTTTGSSIFGYAGEQTDGTGLQFLRARYYSPAQGRFLTQDPFPGFLSQPATLNAYAYAGNNPVLNSDPSGLIAPWLAAGGIGGLIGAGVDIASQISSMHPGNIGQALRCLNWGQVGTAFAAGAIAGMVGFTVFGAASALFGTGLLGSIVSGAFSGVIAGQYGRLTGLVLGGHADQVGSKMFRWQDMVLDGALGGLFGAASYGFTRLRIEIVRRILADAASRAESIVGPGYGPRYGTRVHTAFGRIVESFGRTDLLSERSYLNGSPSQRGLRGSIRVDIVYGSVERPIAVFDLKTGGASLTTARVQQILSHLPPGFRNIPVIEIRP